VERGVPGDPFVGESFGIVGDRQWCAFEEMVGRDGVGFPAHVAFAYGSAQHQ
jgi:hypothetical protein